MIFYRRLPKFSYLAPDTIDEILALLSKYMSKARVIAGGTDLIPKLRSRLIKAPRYIVDLKKINNLDYIKYSKGSGLKLGSLVTIHALATTPVIKENYAILSEAASSMASRQVRNRGTIGGNVCNAVPSADAATALLTLGARVKLISQKGERMANITDFFTGPRQTVINSDEILQEIQIPDLPSNAKGKYLKLSPRHSMDLAVVSVGVLYIPDGQICKDIRISLGAVAPTPIRAKRAESILKGQKLNQELIEKAAQAASEESRPITDFRASAEYRRDMVKVLTRRGINETISSQS